MIDEISKRSKPLVSIIIPFCNAEDFLGGCIESILRQTYEKIEIIAVNNNSLDNSLAVCKMFEDERLKIVNVTKQGVSSARNFGLDKANGEYVVFVDADDIADKTMIEKMVRNISESNAEMVQFTYRELGCDRFVKIENKKFVGKEIDELRLTLLDNGKMRDKKSGAHRCVWGKIFKKSAIGKLRFDDSVKIFEDGIFIFEFLKNAKTVIFINEPIYCYRINNGSASKSNDKDLGKNYLDTLDGLRRAVGLEWDKFKMGFYAYVAECLVTFVSRRARKLSNLDEYKKCVESYITQEFYFDLLADKSLWKLVSPKGKVVLRLLVRHKINSLWAFSRTRKIFQGEP